MSYIDEANQTKSDQFHGDIVSYGYFITVLQQCATKLAELDAIKKALFYGKDGEEDVAVDCDMMPNLVAKNRQQGIDLMHGIIGKATEAGELLEALLDCFKADGQGIDKINVMEELGDGQWYDAVLAKALGFTFEEVQKINIDKLRARYPQKFTELDAQNRDLVEERTVLEGGVHNANHRNYDRQQPSVDDKREAWSCTIGDLAGVEIPPGADLPMRDAVRDAYIRLTGKEPQACFSGWGATFDAGQREVIKR